MKKQLSVLLPLTILGCIIIHCWAIILSTDLLATWRHYLGITLYVLLIATLVTKWKYSIVGLGVYLLLASFALIAVTPSIETNWLSIGPVSTPPIQMLSFSVFILYAIFNFNPLVDLILDYQEKRLSTKAGDNKKF